MNQNYKSKTYLEKINITVRFLHFYDQFTKLSLSITKDKLEIIFKLFNNICI